MCIRDSIWGVRFFRMALGLFLAVNIAFAGLITVVNLELVQTGTDPILIGMLDLAAGAVMVLGALLAPLVLKRVRLGAVIVAGAVCTVPGAQPVSVTHMAWLGPEV